LIIIGIAAFLIELNADIKNNTEIENTETLLAINKEELSILNGNYFQREDGKQFELLNHPYANDLDIFGIASLYQYINRCNSQQGKKLLASHLLSPLTKENILLQQEATKELSSKTQWCQQFQAYGIINPVTIHAEQKINNWLKDEANIFTEKLWHWFVHAYSFVTIACALLYAFDVLTYKSFYYLLLLFLLIASGFSKKVHGTWLMLTKVVDPVNTLYQQLNWLEKESFTSEHISNIKKAIRNEAQLPASHEILQLKKILDRFDVRLNVFVFLLLNTFFLWDLRQITALNTWKKNNANKVPHWFNAIAQTEVVISLATLSFNKSQWVFPEITH